MTQREHGLTPSVKYPVLHKVPRNPFRGLVCFCQASLSSSVIRKKNPYYFMSSTHKVNRAHLCIHIPTLVIHQTVSEDGCAASD